MQKGIFLRGQHDQSMWSMRVSAADLKREESDEKRGTLVNKRKMLVLRLLTRLDICIHQRLLWKRGSCPFNQRRQRCPNWTYAWKYSFNLSVAVFLPPFWFLRLLSRQLAVSYNSATKQRFKPLSSFGPNKWTGLTNSVMFPECSNLTMNSNWAKST